MIAEELERRTLLSAFLRGAIPSHIDPMTAPQAVFPPEIISLNETTTQGFRVVAHELFRFSIANSVPGALTTFITTPGLETTGVDTALALFDADGNLLNTAFSAAAGINQTLSSALKSGTPYVLGVYSDNFLSVEQDAQPFTLMVDASQQRVNTQIKINPATGSTEFLADAAPDTFAGPADVNYFPIDLTNVGQSATVAVGRLGPDDQFFAALYRRDTAGGDWNEITGGSGPTVSLTATPPAGGDDTDAAYLLAVSPLELNTAAEPYKVDVTSATLLGPATAAAASSPVEPVPVSPGVAEKSGTAMFAGPVIERVRAIAKGPFVLSLQSTSANPVLSAYDGTGSILLAVGSRTSPGMASLTMNATPGQQFVVRAGAEGNAFGGVYTLDIKQQYTPTPIAVGSAPGQQAGLAVGPNVPGKVLRLTPPIGADYLVLQLAPDAGGNSIQPEMIAVASGLNPTTATAAAGQIASLVVDLSKVSGPVDLYVIGTAGLGTMTLSYGGVTVPRQLPAGQFAIQPLDLTTGGLSTSIAAPAFGQLSGVQFYEISPGGSQTLSAASSSGPVPIVLRYILDQGVLRLDDRAAPVASGPTTLTANATGATLFAIAAVSLNFTASGSIQLSVSGPTPQGVGVAMVPDPPPPPAPQNGPPPPIPPPFVSKLRIRDVVIRQTAQRDLFATILPFNVNGSPTLSFTPATVGGPLAVKLRVLDPANNVLNTFTTQPGQPLAPQTLSNLTAFVGRVIRFLIEPLPNQPLGDGTYSLELDAPTTDPNPYLATDTSIPATSVPAPITIPFHSSVDGDFTSSQPTTEIYRFTLPDLRTPFQVWTEDLDPTTNTDIKLYRGHYVPGFIIPVPVLDKYVQLPIEPPPSFDYYPADRSAVDARIVANNYHILDNAFADDPNLHDYSPGANTLYVVVKNEQGTQGHYRIHAEAVPDPQLVGPGTLDAFGPPGAYLNIDPESGQASVPFDAATSLVQVATPHGLSGQPTLTVTNFNGPANDTVNVDVYNSSHGFLYTVSRPTAGQVSIPLTGFGASSVYYLDVHLASGNPTSLSISASVSTSSAPNLPPDFDFLTRQAQPYTPTEPYTRATPAPDGTYSFDDVFDPGTSGMLDKIVFYVASSGPSQFSLELGNVSNASFALYGPGSGGISGEFPSFHAGLLDFNSGASDLNFSDFLTPGFYYVRLVGSVPGTGPGRAGISLSLPAYDARRIILDPNFANDDTDPLRTVNDNPFFGTDFYEVDAPGGVQGDLTLQISGLYQSPDPNTNVIDGQGGFNIFKKSGSSFVQVGGTGLIDYYTHTVQGGQPVTTVIIHSGDSPVPGDQYFIGFNRDRLSQDALIGPSFVVPSSGNPDLLVQPIQLLPDNGQTRVAITIQDQGYGLAPSSHAKLNFSNYSYPPPDAFSKLNIAAIGPFGSVTLITTWNPDDPSNTASLTANYDRQFQETDFTNNSQTVALSSVDPVRPTISIALQGINNGESGTWGRYVSGIDAEGHVIVTSADGDAGINPGTGPDLYQTTIDGPIQGGFTATGGNYVSSHTDNLFINFEFFSPSNGSNNDITYSALDAYGLSTGEQVQKVDVVAKPQFLTSISFDPNAQVYDLGFDHSFIDYHHTVSDIIGTDLPVVGDKDNEFLVEVSGSGTADLNPQDAVTLPLTGHVLIKALDNTIYDQMFNGSTQPTDHLSVHTTLDINSRSLDATDAAVSVQLTNLNLLHVETPEIKLFSFGLPGVASIDAGLRFGVDANLGAGVKVGLDPNAAIDPLHAPNRLGIMSPTYIQPSITGSATVEGDVEVLGFDAASLSGTVSLTLQVTFGLDNTDPTKIFPFDQLPLSANVDLILGVHLEADVAVIGSVWSYDYSHDFPLAGNNQIITSDPADGGGGGAAPAMRALDQVLLNPASVLPAAAGSIPPPTERSGSSPVGNYAIDPHPQVVVDPVTGNALSIQVENVGTTAGMPLANLAFSERNNGTWSALAPLGNAEDVSDPALVLTHDGSGTPAVVVYEATNVPGSPAGLTLSQKLTDTDLRYRYFNGSTWGPEQSITNDALMDASPSVAFNATGKGLVAWVHNTNPNPMDNSGNYSAATQDIDAAVWNPATHTWAAPIAITTPDGVSDSKPAAFVEPGGRMYVVWIHDTATGNELMYSTSTGGAWSAPAVLPITTLASGGSFGSVAMGGDRLGHTNILFSYRLMHADNSVDSTLYDLSLDPANPGNTFAEPISHDENFSHLSTTNAPDGSLIAYWQQGDGVTNGVYESTLSRSAASPNAAWTTPTPLTTTADLTLAPSVAADAGRYLVMYHDRMPEGAASPQAGGARTDPPIGVPVVPGVGTSNIALLPELTFSNGLYFPYQDHAVAGGSATGKAVILNSGPAAAQVTINSYVGLPAGGTLVNTRQITLSPGASYDYSQAFVVSAGQQTYSVQVSSATGEAISTADDISTATLTGLPDLTMVSLTPSATNPTIGQPITLTADIKNPSNTAIGPFDVSLQSGDPRFPQLAPGAPQTLHVAALGAGQDVMVTFPLTLPAAAGDYVFTAIADSGHVVSEAFENNNDAQYHISFHADPSIEIAPPMTATLLNATGVSNVSVVVPVANLGTAPIANLPVDLESRRNGAAFVAVASQTILLLNPGQHTTVAFIVNGLAGDNIYRADIDPSVNPIDSNLSNNSSHVELVIRGLPDLTVSSLALSTPTPRQGDPLTLNAVVGNIGIDDASNVLVEVFAIPADGSMLPVASARLSQVPALGQVSISLPIDTSRLLGSYTLRVIVNRLHEVLETTELNNTADIQVTFGNNIPLSNIIRGITGVTNSISLRRDPDGTEDDVWVNAPTSGAPTQLAVLAEPITVIGGGRVDSLAFDATNGSPLPNLLTLNGNFDLAGAPSLAAGQRIDMTGSNVSILYGGPSPLARIQGYLRSGQIFSSTAASTAGIADVDTGSAVTLALARLGDVNQSGTVDFADLLTLAQNYGKGGADWSKGDFNYDRTVNFSDLLILAQNYGQSR